MKKVTISIFFIVDDNNDTSKSISKLKIGLKIESPNSETKHIPLSNNTDLLVLMKVLLNRWDNTSETLTMTTTQWNAFKNKIQDAMKQSSK